MLKEVACGILFATPLGLAALIGLLWLIREVVRRIGRARMRRIAWAWVVSYCDEGDPEPTVTAFDNLDAAANCKHFFVDAGHQRVSLDACSVYSSFEITSRAPRKGGRHGKS